MVTRYESDIAFDGDDDFYSHMAKRVDGDYVLFDDYQTLQQELDDLKERIYELYRSV